jgi:hypothetical protein
MHRVIFFSNDHCPALLFIYNSAIGLTMLFDLSLPTVNMSFYKKNSFAIKGKVPQMI